MRVTIFQPPYPDAGQELEVLKWQIEQLQNLVPGSTDLVIFPENANCTGYKDLAHMQQLIQNEGALFVEEMKKTARRVNCTIMSGLENIGPDGIMRNQLTVFPPDGEAFSPYTKVHLVEPEYAKGIEPGPGATSFEYKGNSIDDSLLLKQTIDSLFVPLFTPTTYHLAWKDIVKVEKTISSDIYNDSLFVKTINIIVQELKEIDYKEEAKMIDNEVKAKRAEKK